MGNVQTTRALSRPDPFCDKVLPDVKSSKKSSKKTNMILQGQLPDKHRVERARHARDELLIVRDVADERRRETAVLDGVRVPRMSLDRRAGANTSERTAPSTDHYITSYHIIPHYITAEMAVWMG